MIKDSDSVPKVAKRRESLFNVPYWEDLYFYDTFKMGLTQEEENTKRNLNIVGRQSKFDLDQFVLDRPNTTTESNLAKVVAVLSQPEEEENKSKENKIDHLKENDSASRKTPTTNSSNPPTTKNIEKVKVKILGIKKKSIRRIKSEKDKVHAKKKMKLKSTKQEYKI